MSQLLLTYTLVPGTPEDISHVQQNFTDIRTWANGNVGVDNFSDATNEQLGANDGSVVRRGKSIVATEQSRSDTAYGMLTTPDQVANVVLPTDGLIAVAYSAMWKESVAGAARAAIFLGTNQIKASALGMASPVTLAAALGAANFYRPLSSAPGYGLMSDDDTAAYTGDVTTGQSLGEISNPGAGGPLSAVELNGTVVAKEPSPGVWVGFAAAGTYTVSVQFKASSGSVTAKERKLWVWTVGF